MLPQNCAELLSETTALGSMEAAGSENKRNMCTAIVNVNSTAARDTRGSTLEGSHYNPQRQHSWLKPVREGVCGDLPRNVCPRANLVGERSVSRSPSLP